MKILFFPQGGKNKGVNHCNGRKINPSLPDSLSNLKFLETLDIGKIKFSKEPEVIKILEKRGVNIWRG